MVGVSGYALTQEEKSFLKEVQPKGVIYFRRNIDHPNQILDLTREIQAQLNHPVMIGIDQEGGPVARLTDPFTEFPSNAALLETYSATKDVTSIRDKARLMAKELKSVGIYLNFTPVADVLTQPNNPVMKDRTFGQDPETVAELVAQTIDVYAEENVLCCAKHFPGHGDTTVDSHLELPVVDQPLEVLKTREWVPFVRAIEHKVPMIMTAHIRFPKIDPNHPATLSSLFLTEMLRGQLGFEGLIVSDDLEMKAIEHHYDIQEACLAAIQAGCNLVLVCEDIHKSHVCFEHLQKHISDQDVQKQLSHTRSMYQDWDARLLGAPLPAKKETWAWAEHQKIAKSMC